MQAKLAALKPNGSQSAKARGIAAILSSRAKNGKQHTSGALHTLVTVASRWRGLTLDVAPGTETGSGRQGDEERSAAAGRTLADQDRYELLNWRRDTILSRW